MRLSILILISILLSMSLPFSFGIIHDRVNEGSHSSPVISDINVTGNLSTGGEVEITVNASDLVGISEVRLLYGWNISVPIVFNNVSMDLAQNVYGTTIVNPMNSTDSLWIRILAENSTGSWNRTGWYRYEIEDDDPPVFVGDRSDDFPYTGDGFVMGCRMSDNIGINTCDAIVWIDGALVGKYSLCGAGDQRQVILMLPASIRGNLSYRFDFDDNSDNNGTSPIFTRQIIDNDAPVLIKDRSDLNATTGDDFKVHLEASDNWNITGSWLIYSISGGGTVNTTMSSGPDGNQTYCLPIPANAEGELVYTCSVIDGSGNVLELPERRIWINDNDLPWIIQDLSDGYSTTGDTFDLNIMVGDNIGIANASVVYRIGSEGSSSKRMSRISKDQYSGRIILDETISSPDMKLYYNFQIVDTSGNTFSSDISEVPIFDNDAPAIVSDLSDIEGYSGEILRLRCLARDNQGIASGKVLLGWNGSDQEERTMLIGSATGSGTELYLDLDIPENFMGELVYDFEIKDVHGNKFRSDGFSLDIKDRKVPEIGSVSFLEDDLVTQVLTTGDVFQVLVEVADNIAAGSVIFIYKPNGTDFPAEVPLVLIEEEGGASTWGATFVIPPYGAGSLQYRIRVLDTSRNQAVKDWIGVQVIDDDPPKILDITYPETIGCGKDFTLVVRIEENVDIDTVQVIPSNGLERIGNLGIIGDSVTINMRSLTDEIGIRSIGIVVSDGSLEDSRTLMIEIIDDISPRLTISVLGEDHDDREDLEFRISIYDNYQWSLDSIIASSGDVSFEVLRFENDNGTILGSFRPTKPGIWTIEVQARDPFENVGTASTSIDVKDISPPFFLLIQGEIDGDRIMAEVLDIVDPAGYKEPYWTVIGPDGAIMTSNGSQLEMKTWRAGIYHVVVEVEDNEGNTAVDEFWVTLEPKQSGDGMNILFWIAISIAVIAGLLVLWVQFKDRITGDDEDDKRKD